MSEQTEYRQRSKDNVQKDISNVCTSCRNLSNLSNCSPSMLLACDRNENNSLMRMEDDVISVDTQKFNEEDIEMNLRSYLNTTYNLPITRDNDASRLQVPTRLATSDYFHDTSWYHQGAFTDISGHAPSALFNMQVNISNNNKHSKKHTNSSKRLE